MKNKIRINVPGLWPAKFLLCAVLVLPGCKKETPPSVPEPTPPKPGVASGSNAPTTTPPPLPQPNTTGTGTARGGTLDLRMRGTTTPVDIRGTNQIPHGL